MASRREQIQLSPAEIRDFLRASHTVILVSNGPGGYPHPMPMWFTVDDDGAVRMTTFRRSQKILNLRRDPRVSLLVESGHEYQELKGVVLYGEAELFDGPELLRDTLLRASGHEPPADPKALEAMNAVFAQQVPKRMGIRVRPRRIVSWDHAKLGGVY